MKYIILDSIWDARAKNLFILKKYILYFNNLKHCDILFLSGYFCDMTVFPARWRYTCCVRWWPRWAKVRWPHFLPTRLNPQVSPLVTSNKPQGPTVTCELAPTISLHPFSGARLETPRSSEACVHFLSWVPPRSRHTSANRFQNRWRVVVSALRKRTYRRTILPHQV